MKQSFAFFLSIIFLFNFHFALAQAPPIEWQHCYGSSLGEYAYSIEPTTDGGYVVAGMTEGNNGDVIGYHGNVVIGDLWVLKLSKTGTIEWQKPVGGIFADLGGVIKQTPDGGYILAGSSSSDDCNFTGGDNFSLDFLLVKLNSKGEMEWEKSLGGSKNEYCYDIALTGDGGYILAGDTESSNGNVTGNYGGVDGWVIKTDATGNMDWQINLGGSGNDEFFSVQAATGGGYVLAGYTESNDGTISGNYGKRDIWVVKLSANGNPVWQEVLGGSMSEEAASIRQTPDGGYIVAGTTSSNDGDVSGNHTALAVGLQDYWLVKLNSTGTLQWQKCYGGKKNENAFSVDVTPDGGYTVAGFAESEDGDAVCNDGATDAWVIKTDANGALQWQKSFGGNYFDEPHCVRALPDGSYIVAGAACSQNISGYHPTFSSNGTCSDFWVVKLAAPATSYPEPSVSINAGSAKICSGRATLTTTVRYAGTRYTFQWVRNGIYTTTTEESYMVNDFKPNEVIICIVSTGGDCDIPSQQVQDTIVLTSNASIVSPAITIGADNTVVCNCTPISFSATVTNSGPSPAYAWFVNNINTGETSPVFTSKTLENGDQVKCVLAEKSACIINDTVVSNSITVTSGTSLIPLVNISALAEEICKGTPVTFKAIPVNAGVNPSYQWKVNEVNASSVADSFTSSSLADGDKVTCVVVPDPLFGCAANSPATSNTVVIKYTGPVTPSVAISSPEATVCKGALATFIARAIDAGAHPLYQWMVNGVATGTNDSTFTSGNLLTGDTVRCSLKPDPLFTCAITATVVSNPLVINVADTLHPSLNIVASPGKICKGDLIEFKASVNNTGTDFTYIWFVNNIDAGVNGPLFRSNTLQNGDQVVLRLSPGTNTCYVSPATSKAINVIVNNQPVITISPADTIIAAGRQVQLHASFAEDLNGFEWRPPGGLENPLSLNPTTIPLTGNVVYTLRAESSKGCVAERSVNINITRDLFMPNAFTPNSDGHNDVFRIPPATSLLLTEFSIYNRWGEKVFSTKNISEGWNGRYKGVEADAGAYVYFIKGANDKGEILKTGSLVLIR